MTDAPKKRGRPAKAKGPVVKVGGAISDGKGGFFAKGATLPEDCDVKSLKAKGLIDG